MEWTIEHEHACWESLKRWTVAGTPGHVRSCAGCTCRRKEYDALVGRRLLPFVSVWLKRTPLVHARFDDDDRQLILVDVHERLAVHDGAELRKMAAVCGIATPMQDDVGGDEEPAFVVDDAEAAIVIEPGDACASVAVARMSPSSADDVAATSATPIQRQLRALYTFALQRRCQQRMPRSVATERRRPPKRFRFTNAAVHAGTRTLELQLASALESQLETLDLDRNPRYLAVRETLATMDPHRLKIYSAYLFGQSAREIARERHLGIDEVKKAIEAAKRAIARALENVPDEE